MSAAVAALLATKAMLAGRVPPFVAWFMRSKMKGVTLMPA